MKMKMKMDALRKKRKIDAAASIIHLPRDMITEVLRKLSVKTLTRFKSVSKTWYALISDPKFHAMQRNIVESIGPSFSAYCQRLLIRNYAAGSDSLTIYNREANYNIFPVTALPVELLLKLESSRHIFSRKLSHYFRAIGPCNGVYLMYDYYVSTAMWNHVTGEYKLLPQPEGYYYSTGIFDREDPIYGFLSEEFVDGRVDFLVLIFFMLETNRKNVLFRSSTGSWKTLKSLPEECYDCETVSKYTVHVNKKIYWLACRRRIHFLICFDTSSETFEKVDLPDCVQEYFPQLSCYTLNGKKSVSLILNENVLTGEMNVWVMNENSEGRSWVSSIRGFRVPENIRGFRVLDESRIEKALKWIKYKYPELADGRAKLWMDGFKYEESLVSLTWKAE